MLAYTRYPALPGVDADALPIVLVHGLGGERALWDANIEDARAVGDVIAVDLPGFGRSPAIEPWTMSTVADAIVELLDELSIRSCIAVGQSLGGGIAIHLAALHPARVGGVIAVSPAGWLGTGSGEVSARDVRRNDVQRQIIRLGAKHLLRVPAMRRMVFRRLVHDPTKITARQAVELASSVARGRQTPHAVAAVYAIQLRDDLPKLTMPVHIIWGREDQVVPVQFADVARAEIADVEIDLLDAVGHNAQLEVPEVLARAMRSIAVRAQGADAPAANSTR